MTTISPDKPNIIEKTYRRLIIDFQSNPLKYLFVLPVLIFFIIFLVIPTTLVFLSAFKDQDGNFTLGFFGFIFSSSKFFDWNGREGFKWIEINRDNFYGETWLILNGNDYGVVLNSIIIATLTTILALVLGVSLALFMAKRDFPGKSIVSILLLIPLIIPPFVGGIGFFAMMGIEGIVNTQVLSPVFGLRIIVKGTIALVVVEAFHYYTLIYLNVYGSLINVDPTLEEQARNLGAKGFHLLRTITLPLALPGIAAGSILTFILSLEDLGTPIVFAENGDQIAKETMTYYIFENLESYNPDNVNIIPSDSGVVGTILLVIALIGFFLIRKYVALRSYSMEGKGRAGDRTVPKAKLWEVLGFYSIYAVIFFISILSHLGIILRAFNVVFGKTGKAVQGNLINYKFIFNSANDITPFISNTVKFSFMSLFIIIIFGTMAAYAIARFEFFGKNAFDALITIPIALPGVVIGLGYLEMFTGSKSHYILQNIGINTDFILTLDPFIYPVLILISSYAVRKFPFAVRSIFAGIQQTSVDLEEAALNVGASRTESLASITIPLISLNILAGGLVSLVYTISEVSTTLVLVSDESYGTITWFMGNSVANRIGIFAALGTLLMILQILSIVVSSFLLKNRAEAMTGI